MFFQCLNLLLICLYNLDSILLMHVFSSSCCCDFSKYQYQKYLTESYQSFWLMWWHDLLFLYKKKSGHVYKMLHHLTKNIVKLSLVHIVQPYLIVYPLFGDRSMFWRSLGLKYMNHPVPQKTHTYSKNIKIHPLISLKSRRVGLFIW